MVKAYQRLKFIKNRETQEREAAPAIGAETDPSEKLVWELLSFKLELTELQPGSGDFIGGVDGQSVHELRLLRKKRIWSLWKLCWR